MEAYARETAEIENSKLQAKADIMKVKALENQIKLKKDTLSTEI